MNTIPRAPFPLPPDPREPEAPASPVRVEGYPPPQLHPTCQCWPNLMAAFFCPTGHMTECHYPLTCTQAQCAYLARCRDEEI